MMDKHTSEHKNSKMSSGKFANKSYGEEDLKKTAGGVEEEMDIEVDEYDLEKPAHNCGCGCKNHNIHY